MENVIITEHASFRYCQRIRGEALINLASYKSSIKFDADKYKTVESEILDKLSKSIFVVCGAFDKDNIKSNFYLNKEERIIFVLDSSQTKLITLYKVDYGFGSDVNTITMNALLKEIDKLKSNKEKYINKYSKDLEQKESAIKSLDYETNMLQQKIKLLESQKNILIAELELYDDTVETMSKEIESKAHSICHSIGYKRQEEFNY